MNYNKALIFFCCCVVLRLLISYIVTKLHGNYLKYAGYISAIPVYIWISQFIFNLRPRWWNFMRPIHAFMYGAFAWYAIQGINSNFIFYDTIIGIVAFLYHYSI